jgi:hypothetical protein
LNYLVPVHRRETFSGSTRNVPPVMAWLDRLAREINRSWI